MEPESSFPHSRELSTCPCPELDHASPYLSLKDPSYYYYHPPTDVLVIYIYIYIYIYYTVCCVQVPTFADRGCHVVSVTDPYGRILGFLDRSRYFFF
jgi:hypothetical protein